MAFLTLNRSAGNEIKMKHCHKHILLIRKSVRGKHTASDRVTFHLIGGMGSKALSIALLQCEATFVQTPTFCLKIVLITGQPNTSSLFLFSNVTLTLQDNFRNLTSQIIYIIILRSCCAAFLPLIESS